MSKMLELAPAIFAVALILFLPGYLMLRAARLPRSWAVASAPPITLAALTVWGELLSRVGVPASPATLLAPLVAAPAVLAVLMRDKPQLRLPPLSWMALALSCAAGLGVGWYAWVATMPSAQTVYQLYDVVHHLAHVRTYLDTRRFTFFSDFYYPMPRDEVVNPWPSSGFYPSAWHMTCAAAVQVSGAHEVAAFHATNLVFCGFVFPLATQCLVAYVFRGHTAAQLAGAVASVAFAVFPWGLMGWGPVVSQLAAFTMVPIAIWLFMGVIEPGAPTGWRVRFAVLFVLALLGVALAQPNAAFSAALFLVPRCVVGIWRAGTPWLAPQQDELEQVYSNRSTPRHLEGVGERGASDKTSVRIVPHRLALAFSLVVGVAWCALPFTPPLHEIATFGWPMFAEPPQALLHVLTLDYVQGLMPSAGQVALAAALYAGIARTLVERRNRWVSVSYLIVAAILFVCTFDETLLRSALAGYWYTDPYRIASMCAIFGAPLVAFGLAWAPEALLARARGTGAVRASRLAQGAGRAFPVVAGVVLTLAFSVLNFAGGRLSPALMGQLGAFTAVRDTNKTFFSMNAPYSQEEDAFLQRVRDKVGPDAAILNDPYDGSIFGYPLYNLRLTYRFNDGYIPGGERLESIDVRHRAHLYTQNPLVADDLRALGIEYLLQLDNVDHAVIFGPSDDYQLTFQGVRNVTEETPGFELVMAEGDRKLYRLTELW